MADQEMQLQFDNPLKSFGAGLRWDENPELAKRKFRLFARHDDLDLCCALLDKDKALIDFFTPRAGQDEAQAARYRTQIMHTGDRKDGGLSYNDEEIRINLARLDPNVHHVVFIVSNANDKPFQDVAGAACHFIDDVSCKRFMRVDLHDYKDDKGKPYDRAFAVAMLTRGAAEASGDDGWSLKTVGKYAGVDGLVGVEKELIASLAL